MSKTKWGILATGRIAEKFARGLGALQEAELVAVGSRSRQSAQEFGDRWGVPRRHASYPELAEDPEVEVVYVSTPHPFHKENAMLCLRAGKAVLCEKPLTVNAAEAEELIGCAREAGAFLMEAMWMRFLPAVRRLKAVLAEGRLGEVRQLRADFSIRLEGNPPERWRLDPGMAGGALLDLGVYCLALASMVFGPEPTEVLSSAHMRESGVDGQDAIILQYDGGRQGVLTCGNLAASPHEAYVSGTEGWAHLHRPFWRSQALTLGHDGEEDETLELPFKENGYEYEAAHVTDCLRQGKQESPLWPLSRSLANMRLMDEIRAQWGLRFPADR